MFLLLSCLMIGYSSNASAALGNSLVPIYSDNDDLSLAPVRPTIIYNEVKDSKIVIPNMPAYETQDDIGECRGFSVRVLMQKYTCDKWKKDIPDCAHPPADLDISSFGMMIYTNKDHDKEKTFQPSQTGARNMYSIILEISKNPSFILSSCKPVSNMVNTFSMTGQKGLDVRDKFFAYLKSIYDQKKSTTEASIADCPECLAEIEKNTGLNKDLVNLKKALSQDSYDKFLYSLFFDGCKLEGFADGFKPYGFPDNNTKANPVDVKNKIIEGLKKGKPVIFPNLCVSVKPDNSCKEAHSLVISGYKKVCNGNICKDVFKVHNSFGASWQKANNDGWVDADLLTASTVRKPNQNPTSPIDIASVVWLEP